MSRDDHAVQLIEIAMAAKTKTEHYYSAHNVATRVSFGTYASVQDSVSLRWGQNLHGPFLRATLPMTVGSCAQVMTDSGETKGLIILPPR